MAMPKGYEDDSSDDGGFITPNMDLSDDVPIKKTPKIKTPKKTRKNIKIVWVLFWISLIATQGTAGLLMIDFEHPIIYSGVRDALEDAISKEILVTFPYIVFFSLMPVWYFSIKYRHQKKTLLLMFVLIVPTILINIPYIVMGMIALMVIAVLIVGIIFMSPIGRGIIFRFYRIFFKRGKNDEPNWSWERD